MRDHVLEGRQADPRIVHHEAEVVGQEGAPQRGGVERQQHQERGRPERGPGGSPVEERVEAGVDAAREPRRSETIAHGRAA